MTLRITPLTITTFSLKTLNNVRNRDTQHKWHWPQLFSAYTTLDITALSMSNLNMLGQYALCWMLNLLLLCWVTLYWGRYTKNRNVRKASFNHSAIIILSWSACANTLAYFGRRSTLERSIALTPWRRRDRLESAKSSCRLPIAG